MGGWLVGCLSAFPFVVAGHGEEGRRRQLENVLNDLATAHNNSNIHNCY